MPDQLAPVDMPIELLYLWEWYLELSAGRNYGSMGGPLPISHLEIAGWCGLNGIELEKWELRTIKALDRLERMAAAEEYKANRPKPKGK